MLTNEPTIIVQSEFDILEPKYAFIYFVRERDSGAMVFSIETFYFKRKSILSLEFEVEERFSTDVIGKNLTFEEVVDLADSRNVREMQEEELVEIDNIEEATRWNNPTPEQQANDAEDRIVKYEYSLNNPSNTDSLEWWDSKRGTDNEYILVKNTGNKMLTDEKLQMTKMPNSKKPNYQLFQWINDEQVVYAWRFNCIVKRITPNSTDKGPGGDHILIYDVPTDTHKKIIEYPEDTDNCLRDEMAIYEDEFVILREKSIEKFDLDGNYLSTTMLDEDLYKITDYTSTTNEVKSFSYDGKVVTIEHKNVERVLGTEIIELE
jgi:hypothetical protein